MKIKVLILSLALSCFNVSTSHAEPETISIIRGCWVVDEALTRSSNKRMDPSELNSIIKKMNRVSYTFSETEIIFKKGNFDHTFPITCLGEVRGSIVFKTLDKKPVYFAVKSNEKNVALNLRITGNKNLQCLFWKREHPPEQVALHQSYSSKTLESSFSTSPKNQAMTIAER